MQENPVSIPESGRSSGEGIVYPLQYSWASLLAQMVKNPTAMWETWVQSLDWEGLLVGGMATHCSILPYARLDEVQAGNKIARRNINNWEKYQ